MAPLACFFRCFLSIKKGERSAQTTDFCAILITHGRQASWVFREVDDSGMRSYRRGFGRNFKFLDPLLMLLHKDFTVNKQAVFINFAEDPASSGGICAYVEAVGKCPTKWFWHTLGDANW